MADENEEVRIKDLTETATDADLVSDNYFVIDGSEGTKRLNSTTLLMKTTQNALATSAADEAYFLSNGQKKSILGSDLATEADMPLVNLLGQTSGDGKKPVKVQIPYMLSRSAGVANVLWNEIDKKSDRRFGLQHGYYAANGTNVGNFTESESYRCAKISAVTGQNFIIAGQGTTTARLWFTYDVNGKIVRRADANTDTTASPVTITIESGELGIGFNTSYSASFDRRIELSSIPNAESDIISFLTASLAKKTDSVIRLGDITTGSNKLIPIVLGDKFNIRFKLRLPKNMYNRFSGYGFFKLVNYNVTAQTTTVKLTQATKTFTDNGVSKTSYLPYWLGGIAFQGGSASTFYMNRNIGPVAFTIKYIGLESSATIVNDGTTLTITEGLTTHSFTLSNYSTMDDLYDALLLLTNFEFDFGTLENRIPEDLAVFNEAKLVSEFKNPIEQGGSDVVYTDKAKFFVKYQDNDSLHDAEIFSNGNGKIVVNVDGDYLETSVTLAGGKEETLVFYTGNGFKFYDIQVCTDSELDAEIIDAGTLGKRCISSHNPIGIILEGHGISSDRSSETSTEGMDASVDRLQLAFDMLREKGYECVTLDEIKQWKLGFGRLPKKFFSCMFDDWRFDNFTDLRKRSVFGKNGVKANLAVVTSADLPITIDGQSITIEKAVSIGKNVGFECYSHTKDHTNFNQMKFRDIESVMEDSIYDADLKGVHSDVIVYPYGASNNYVYEVAKWLGCGVCVDVATNYVQKRINDGCLFRVEVGNRVDVEYLLTYIL